MPVQELPRWQFPPTSRSPMPFASSSQKRRKHLATSTCFLTTPESADRECHLKVSRYEQWQSVVAVNLNGAFLCAQEAYRAMKDQIPQGGRIINNGSISAHVPRPNSAPYTATKHAVTGLTKSLSLDGRKYNIACSQIDIGNAATSLTEKMKKGILQANGEIAVEPRMDVEHAANAVVYMAGLPLDANIQFMTIMATTMPYIGRG